MVKCRANKHKTYDGKLLVAVSKIDEVAVINCNNLKGANDWIAELKQSYPNINFIPTELSAAVGVHAGEGTLGLTWVRG